MNALEIAALSMQLDQQRLQTIAHNVANSTTPGYKRSVVRAEEFASLMRTAETAAEDAAPDTPAALNTSTDMKQGAMRQTGQALDIALQGDGFLELAQPEGYYLSRGGSLRLDDTGRLVTAAGMAVAGQRGEILIQAPLSAISIERNGTVRVNGEPFDQLKLVRPAGNAHLQQVGAGVFALDETAQREVRADTATSVLSGHLEASNVNSTREIVTLMETTRHYESMQRAIQAYDDVVERTLRKLGEQ